jgi:hypothetical protein
MSDTIGSRLELTKGIQCVEELLWRRAGDFIKDENGNKEG